MVQVPKTCILLDIIYLTRRIMALDKINQIYQHLMNTFGSQRRKLIKNLIIVKIHADWCDKSKLIHSRYSSLKNKFESNSVLFLELDFTDQCTEKQAKQVARTFNMVKLLENKQNTGQILLLDADNRFVLDQLHKNMLFSEMVQSVQKYLN